jgi:hypothetical protein
VVALGVGVAAVDEAADEGVVVCEAVVPDAAAEVELAP